MLLTGCVCVRVCVCVCACVQQHEKQVREKKRTLKQVKKSIAELMEKNSELMKELESLNVAVNERRHIHELSGGQTRRPAFFFLLSLLWAWF